MSIVSWIIIVNVVVFALQCVWTRPMSQKDIPKDIPLTGISEEEFTEQMSEMGLRVPVLQDWLALDRRAITHGQIWRLATYDLLHDTSDARVPWHLIMNMYLLYILGSRVVDIHSYREFLFFYVASAVFSGLFYLLWGIVTNENHSAIGASGAVSAVLVIYAMRWPNETWTLFFFIPVTARWLVIIYAGLDVFPMLKQLGGMRDYSGVAHSAHIGGMLFGFLYEYRHWNLESLLGSWNLSNPFKRRPKLRVVRDSDMRSTSDPHINEEKLQARLDELLAKISEHGQASLTAAEQAELMQASKYFQKKR